MRKKVLVMRRLLMTLAILLLIPGPTTQYSFADEVGPPLTYRARLVPLNQDPVAGEMRFVVIGDRMLFSVDASGLVPSKNHGMQIRGFTGETTDAVLPPTEAAGADGVLTLPEAQGYLGIDRLL